MNLEIAGRTALVVGASRGIGRAVALMLSSEGVNVGVMARTRAKLEDVVSEIEAAGGKAIALAGDVSSTSDRGRCLQSLQEKFGRASIVVVSNAALFEHKKLHTMSAAEIDQQLSVDGNATLQLLREVLPDMMREKHGRIVLLGSLTASAGFRGSPVYAMVKAGFSGLVKGLAADYGRYGITANVVSPAAVETERFAERVGGNAAIREAHSAKTVSGRILTVESVATAVVQLCGKHAWGQNGSTVEIHNGQDLALP